MKTCAPARFTRISALLLAIVAMLQALRFLFAWPVTINGTAVPVWASAVFAVIAALLALKLWRESVGDDPAMPRR